MFYQIFVLAQVKGSPVIGYKYLIYELSHDLRVRVIGNEKISQKCLHFIE